LKITHLVIPQITGIMARRIRAPKCIYMLYTIGMAITNMVTTSTTTQ